MGDVCILVASNQRRGAEGFAVRLAADLSGHGVAANVFAVDGIDPGPGSYPEIEVLGSGRRDPSMWVRAERAAARSSLVLGVGSSALMVGAGAATAARRPFVYRSIGDPAFWGQVRWSNLRIGVPLRRASAVVALFPRARDELVRRYGIDPSIVSVIPTSVDPTRFPLADSTARTAARTALAERLGEHARPAAFAESGRPLVAYVGALSPEKDPALLVEAAAVAASKPMLVFAGAGPMQQSIAALAADRGVAAWFLGPLSDVAPVFAACDVLALPSKTEGTPGVAIEAGMSGRVVVATDVGGNPFIVRDGVTGVISADRSVSGFATALDQGIELSGVPGIGAIARERCCSELAVDVVSERWRATLLRAMDPGPVT